MEEEQDANFISRLHNGRLDILPWFEFTADADISPANGIDYRPVIESKEFYKLFPTLKRRLDQQPMTHHTAGEFLGTLKTLMAKLKVSEVWCSCLSISDTHLRQMIGVPSLVG